MKYYRSPYNSYEEFAVKGFISLIVILLIVIIVSVIANSKPLPVRESVARNIIMMQSDAFDRGYSQCSLDIYNKEGNKREQRIKEYENELLERYK